MFRRSLLLTTSLAAISLTSLIAMDLPALAADKPRKGASVPARPKQPAADAAAQLASLAWIEGVWVSRQGKDTLEESWFAPHGDSMVGMFRWMKDGDLWMTELMTITIDDGALVFRLRHFDRRHTAWEEKDAPMTCKLKSIADREVTFERVDGKKAGSGYRIACPGPDAYEVTLLPPENAPGNPQKFTFTRKKH